MSVPRQLQSACPLGLSPGRVGSTGVPIPRRHAFGSECQGRSLLTLASSGAPAATTAAGTSGSGRGVQHAQQKRRQQQDQGQQLYYQLPSSPIPGSLHTADELDMPYTLDPVENRLLGSMQAATRQESQLDLTQEATQPQHRSSVSMHHTRLHGTAQPVNSFQADTLQQQDQGWNDSQPRRSQRRSYHTLSNTTSGRTQSDPPNRHVSQQQQQPEQHNPGHDQGADSRAMHPRQLTQVLSRCQSLSELQQQCRKHLDNFNHVHVACAMNRLAKCPEVTQPQYAVVANGMMQTLEVLFVHHLPQYTAREVANALWCWAKVSHQPRSSTKQMMSAAITARSGALLLHHACTTQALANLAWGLAGLKWTDAGVWDCLTAAVHASLRRHQQHRQGQGGGSDSGRWRSAPRSGSAGSRTRRSSGPVQDPGWFAPVDVACLAFSYASARRSEAELFATLIEVAQSEVQEFCAIDLCNVLWACATMRYTPRGMFVAAAPAVVACIAGFTPQGVANTAWAYAIAGVPSPHVFSALSRRAQQHGEQLQPAHHAQLVWAMVRAKQVHPPVVHAAIASALAQHESWQTHNLARLLYSLAAGDMTDSIQFSSLTPLLTQRLRRIHDQQARQEAQGQGVGHTAVPQAPVCFQDVSQVLWAHAMANVYDEELFRLAQQVCLADPEAWVASPASFQSLIWSFGYAGHYHPELFQVSAKELASLTPSCTHMSLSQIASVLVSLAQVQHADAAACAAVAAYFRTACCERASSVSNATLMTVLWALMLLGYADEPLLRASLGLIAQRWQIQSVYMLQSPPRRSRAAGLRSSRAHADEDAWPEGDAAAVVAAQAVGFPGNGAPDVTSGGQGMADEAAMGGEGSLQEDTAAVPRQGIGLNGEHLYNKQMSQLFQLIMWLQDKNGSQGTALVHELVPESLHNMAAAVWQDYTRKECMVSSFQNELYKALQALGVRCQLEQLTADSMFSMDTVVHIGGCYVSVEANGPRHYTRTWPRSMLGSKVLRDRFVRARGYAVLNVPYWEWEAIEGDGGAVARYLHERLVEVVGPAAAAELPKLDPGC